MQMCIRDRFMAIDQYIAGCEQGSQQITGYGVEKELKKEGLLSADTLPSPVEYTHQDLSLIHIL